MATFDLIRVLGEGLLAIMREKCPFKALELGPDTPFALASLTMLSGTAALKDGFYLCSWRVGIGGAPRNLPPRRTLEGELRRPSLPLDLHYLLIPAAADAARQARMLGWCLRFMHDLPSVSGEMLNRYASNAQGVFGPNESVEIFADPLALADYLAIWDRVKNVFPGGMTYLARMVLLDSDMPEAVAPLVNARVFDLQRPEVAR